MAKHVTVLQAAALLGVSAPAIHYMITRKRLRPIARNPIRFDVNAVLSYLAARDIARPHCGRPHGSVLADVQEILKEAIS